MAVPEPVAVQDKPGWLPQVGLFLTAQSVSLFGSAIVGYAVIWYVTLKTGSGGQYALLLIASQLAMALTTIPGGVWADRYWRKALMMGADAGVAVVTLVLAILMLYGIGSVWIIALVLALRGLGGGIQSPAVGAALPQIAPAGKLLRINSLNQALQALIQVAAPALAAVLLTYLPLGVILMVDVVTAAIGIGVTALIRIPRLVVEPVGRPEGVKGYARHVGEALRFGWQIPAFRRVVGLMVLLLTVVIPYAQMTPVFVVRLYGPEQWMLAAVEILFSVGMVVGGVAMAAWGGVRNRMTMVMAGAGAIALATLVMGFMPSIWLFVVLMFIGGLALPVMNTPALTALQEIVPEAMMGRMISILTFLNVICAPIGMAIVGPLADHLDIRWMAFAGGAVGLVVLVALAVRGGPGSQLMAPEVGSAAEAQVAEVEVTPVEG